MFKKEIMGVKLSVLIILVLVVIISMAVISPIVSNVSNRTRSIDVLDDIKLSALGLTATATSTSLLVSAMPDDTGSPIADELADLSDLLMIIVCVIYLEKFLLTFSGFVAFSVLIPIAVALFGATLFKPSAKLRSLSVKFLVLALLLFLLVPSSAKITSMVQDTFEESLKQTFSIAEEFSQAVESTQEQADSNFFKQLWEGISNGVTQLVDMAKNVLSALTDAVSVLLITACIIPLLTLLVFVYAIRKLFGSQISLPDPRLILHKLPLYPKNMKRQA